MNSKDTKNLAVLIGFVGIIGFLIFGIIENWETLRPIFHTHEHCHTYESGEKCHTHGHWHNTGIDKTLSEHSHGHGLEKTATGLILALLWIFGWHAVTRKGKLLEILGRDQKINKGFWKMAANPWSECRLCMGSFWGLFWFFAVCIELNSYFFFQVVTFPVLLVGIVAIILELFPIKHDSSSIVNAINELGNGD